jgi:hypothetical protein
MRLIARGRYGLFDDGDRLTATDTKCYFRDWNGSAMIRRDDFVSAGDQVTAASVDGTLNRTYSNTGYTHVSTSQVTGRLRSQDLAFAGNTITVP